MLVKNSSTPSAVGTLADPIPLKQEYNPWAKQMLAMQKITPQPPPPPGCANMGAKNSGGAASCTSAHLAFPCIVDGVR